MFDAGYPTTGATTVCSADVKRERWGWMLQQPIQPPNKYAGINMAKDDLWHGLTIEDAESAPPDPTQPGGGLCQSVPLGFVGGCPSGIGYCDGNYWGNNAEVNFFWNLATHKVDQMTLTLGYQGAMTATSDTAATVCDKTNPSGPVVMQGAHTYVVRVGDVIKKDGQPFLIDWNDPKARGCEITEIYNAMMFTYAPPAGVPYAAAKNCSTDGNCLVFNSQGTTIFGVRPMALYFQGSSGVPQPALSTPTLVYNFSTKFMPYSNLPQALTLDANGPNATGISRGAKSQGTCATANTSCTLTGGGTGLCDTDLTCKVVCKQQVGQSFANMKTNCIQVTGNSTVDTVNLNKVLYGLTHDFEHWTGNIMGINQNFTSSAVAANPNSVVLDTDTPQDADIAQDWTFDIRARGHVSNDYMPPAYAAPDFRGSALVYNEWARLMLLDINKQMSAQAGAPVPARTLGDANCTNGNFAAGCSGIEGLILPSGAAYGVAPPNFGPAEVPAPSSPSWDIGYFYGASILKPGDIIGGFCVDPGSFTDCSATNSPWDQAQKWVLRRLGKGVLSSVPSELRDRRYYYKWFAVAYLKYMKAYSHACVTNPAPACDAQTAVPPSKVAAEVIDLESLFFDNNNGGVGNGFDKFEYVDREYIGQGQTGTPGAAYNWIPWDFEYGSDIIGGNQRYDNWYRRMDREEIAMYASMLTVKTHTPGLENNVNITNLFGSAILPGTWPSYECAIGQAGDPASSGCGVPPPIDASVHPCTTNTQCITAMGVNAHCAPVTTSINGVQNVCVSGGCNFPTAGTGSGCTSVSQACVAPADGSAEGCVDIKMDLNAAQANAHPYLWYYPGAWSRTPFSAGHSPITLHAADKHPFIGAAKITIPNFAVSANGPYAASPQLATYDSTGKPVCPATFTSDIPGGNWCNAPLTTPVTGNPWSAASYTPLVPWLENQPGVGFNFPIDGQHDQNVQTAQLDFTGVLETYLVDFVPWVDTAGKGANPSCAAGIPCGTGYTCNPVSQACEKSDDTIQILAIEAEDFLGAAFLCQDPHTGDILGVRQYDSAQAILDWMAGHQGGWNVNTGNTDPSAQAACNIIIRQSPNNNYIDFITSKTNGVKLSINQGSGQGRVTDIVVYDPGIVQTP